MGNYSDYEELDFCFLIKHSVLLSFVKKKKKSKVKMALELEEFLKHPTEKELEKMSKNFLEVAARVDIELTAKEKCLKEGVGLIVKSGLADLGVFTTKPEKSAVSEGPIEQVNPQKCFSSFNL